MLGIVCYAVMEKTWFLSSRDLEFKEEKQGDKVISMKCNDNQKQQTLQKSAEIPHSEKRATEKTSCRKRLLSWVSEEV